MPRGQAGETYHLPLNWGERLFAIGSNTQYLERLARQAGLEFNFNAQGSNTLDSHRLLLLAEHADEESAKENADGTSKRTTFALDLRLNLADKYFRQGRRLADHALLLAAVNEVGMDVDRAAKVLAGNEYKAEVLDSARRLTQSGIHSIPVFLFSSGDFSATVHGSSNQAEFERVFREAEEHWRKAA